LDNWLPFERCKIFETNSCGTHENVVKNRSFLTSIFPRNIYSKNINYRNLFYLLLSYVIKIELNRPTAQFLSTFGNKKHQIWKPKNCYWPPKNHETSSNETQVSIHLNNDLFLRLCVYGRFVYCIMYCIQYAICWVEGSESSTYSYNLYTAGKEDKCK